MSATQDSNYKSHKFHQRIARMQGNFTAEEVEDLRRDSERWKWMRQFLSGYKWADTPFADIRFNSEEKYLSPASLDESVDRVINAQPPTK